MANDLYENLGDYLQWKNINSDTQFSFYDYIHGLFQSENLQPDLAIAFLKLLWPEFIVHDNLIFLREEFSIERYQELIEGDIDRDNIEYWMNLLNIDKLINSSICDVSLYFSSELASMWSKKLLIDFPDKKFKVEFFAEGTDQESEVYIVFFQEHISF